MGRGRQECNEDSALVSGHSGGANFGGRWNSKEPAEGECDVGGATTCARVGEGRVAGARTEEPFV